MQTGLKKTHRLRLKLLKCMFNNVGTFKSLKNRVTLKKEL